jgi:hypothetical protein
VTRLPKEAIAGVFKRTAFAELRDRYARFKSSSINTPGQSAHSKFRYQVGVAFNFGRKWRLETLHGNRLEFPCLGWQRKLYEKRATLRVKGE